PRPCAGARALHFAPIRLDDRGARDASGRHPIRDQRRLDRRDRHEARRPASRELEKTVAGHARDATRCDPGLPLHLLLERRSQRRRARARIPEGSANLRRSARAGPGPRAGSIAHPLSRHRWHRERSAMKACALFAIALALALPAFAADGSRPSLIPYVWNDVTGARDMPWI